MSINIEQEAAVHTKGVESAQARVSVAVEKAMAALGSAAGGQGKLQVKAFADAEARLSQAVLDARMLAASLEITRSRVGQMRKQVEA